MITGAQVKRLTMTRKQIRQKCERCPAKTVRGICFDCARTP